MRMMRQLRKQTALVLAVALMSMSAQGMTCKHPTIEYRTHSGQVVEISNQNLQVFLRGVQIASRSYTGTERALAVVILNHRDAGDMEAATVLYNRVKPIDTAIVDGFTALSHSIDITVKVNDSVNAKDMSVPQALIDHAGDILAQMQRILKIAEDNGIDLPPGFTDSLNMMELLTR